MSQVTHRGAVKPSLNITPLIDVVFLLIVFFLLVNNIVTDEAPELKLPDVEQPAASQVAEQNRLVINILPEDAWAGEPGPGAPVMQVVSRSGHARQVKVGGAGFDYDDPAFLTQFRSHMTNVIGQRRSQGDLRFLLRVDAAIYYEQVLPVMDALQNAMIDAGLDPDQGETQIDIVTYMPQD